VRPDVKICGLTRAEDVEAAILYGADYLGFIVEAKSARRLTVETAAKLSRPAKDLIPSVAVTVNADDDLLSRLMTQMQPDFIQCHGDETPDRIRHIKNQFDVKIIKAIPISSRTDLDQISNYDVDMVLLDAKAPKGAARGGHGHAFDWTILNGAKLPKNWALAGGLNVDRVADAIQRTNAPILDVSSGVEAAPGLKDRQKIRGFMERVKPDS